MDKLTQFGYPFILVVEHLKEALRLHDMQIPVMLGKLDDAKTFEDAGIKNCAMVVATDDDIRNVNIAFRARDAHQVASFPRLVIVKHQKILSLTGANHVVKVSKQMGAF